MVPMPAISLKFSFHFKIRPDVNKLMIVTYLFTISISLFSNDKIGRLTYSIADTSKIQTEQAREVYSWITENIAYDTHQLEEGNKYYSPEQTLRRKKALCYGYSELFHEMCEVLGIESYIIYGYCKGFDYVKGEPLT